VSYCGSARTDDRDLIELNGCVAPMLPMDQFDDFAAVSRRFKILLEGKPENGGFLWASRIEPRMVVGGNGANRLIGELQVPTSAPFFAEHFPRKPVFPATLLLDAQMTLGWQLASHLLQDVLQDKLQSTLGLEQVRDVKARSFISPGQTLMLECVAKEISARGVEVALSAKIGSKVVATSVADFAVKESA
jgi:3-hydroxymyristoyl/3-hydroxydecanoyl-(acyl carrier protein) dehydratase